ncbi:unnamed protein product [Psylliodes chrysocephalus]|uniref:Uncharacterized protein n=1 Tax=Psylliodes chrysocephalus TaxID=3402493 RepID=A0A9P0D4Z8_9CUCU|nr:unnamed protein product [Psylliodes chrysocephala]
MHKTKLLLWQHIWEHRQTGPTIYNIIRKVSTKWVGYTWKTTQTMTGHGNKKAYYDRFHLRDDIDTNCEHCGTYEDLDHATIHCNEQRLNARQLLTNRLATIQKIYPPTDIDTDNKQLVSWINQWGEAIIHDENDD